MRPNELIVRMLREDGTAILFDRRDDVERQASLLGFEALASMTVSSPLSELKVSICLLKQKSGGEAQTRDSPPSGARRGSSSFIRLLDRFFVPAAGDPEISALLFELIAARYEELTTLNVNSRTAELLLRSALEYQPNSGPKKVLDFGCGTGCAVSASQALVAEGHDIELFGTDISPSMLAIAQSRGERVVPLEVWRAMRPNTFDVAISCFVLHYGVPSADLAHLACLLKPNGIFSANLFKGDDIKLAQLTDDLRASGLDLVSNRQMSTTFDTYNRHLVFKRRATPLASSQTFL